MIIESILNLLKTVITTVFGILPSIPTFTEAQTSINELFDLIFEFSGLLGVFVKVETIHLCIPIIILIWNFEHVYNLTLWIIKKIPMFGVQ